MIHDDDDGRDGDMGERDKIEGLSWLSMASVSLLSAASKGPVACGPVGLWACGACDLGVYRTVGAGANLGYPRARKQGGGQRGIVTKKRAVCDERTIQRPIPITTPYRNHGHRQAQSSLKHTARFGLRQLIDWVSYDRSVSVEQFNSGFADKTAVLHLVDRATSTRHVQPLQL